MAEEVIFHRLVQKDMTGIRRYYIEEAGDELADRSYDCFMETVARAISKPRRYHPIEEGDRVRRAPVKGFPYHFLYGETVGEDDLCALQKGARFTDFAVFFFSGGGSHSQRFVRLLK